ncbi:MAG TPA: beta-N-acetylhexosaminidase [Clostridiales bacterium]|nr:beta-N-acetylhexosaminidase [Clostridiales bacterium]
MDQYLKKKIGQLFIAGFPSAELDNQVRRLMNDFGVCNYVLFARNLVNPRQASELCTDLTNLVLEGGSIFAPFIGVDQEGGLVTRIQSGALLFPGPMALAASEMDAANEIGYHTGRILRAMGINSNFAPVLDVNISPENPIIGTRAYGDDPERVAKLGIDFMHGLMKAKVLSLVKHYPGHGNVSGDSHLELPKNNTPKETLESTEWMPFQNAFINGADALMTAHVCYVDIDKRRPATLSPLIMHDLLRTHMGFCGLVFTDCMEMDAIKKHFGIGEGAVMAIEAGCDLLTFSHTLEAVEEAFRSIYDAVKGGRLQEARLDESLKRIAVVKTKYGLTGQQEIDADLAESLCYDESLLELYGKISEASVTLLSGSGKVEDIVRIDKKVFFSPESLALTGVEDEKQNRLCFSELCARHLGGMSVVTPINGINEETESILSRDFDAAVLGLYNARFRPGQVQLLRRLETLGKPLIVVLLGAPYDAQLIKRADAVIAAYEYTPLSVKAVIKALKNNYFPGKTPVKLTL